MRLCFPLLGYVFLLLPTCGRTILVSEGTAHIENHLHCNRIPGGAPPPSLDFSQRFLRRIGRRLRPLGWPYRPTTSDFAVIAQQRLIVQLAKRESTVTKSALFPDTFGRY